MFAKVEKVCQLKGIPIPEEYITVEKGAEAKTAPATKEPASMLRHSGRSSSRRHGGRPWRVRRGSAHHNKESSTPTEERSEYMARSYSVIATTDRFLKMVVKTHLEVLVL